MMQAPGGGRIKGIAGFLESGKAVGIQHFRPQIGVIARRIAVAAKDMGEMRYAMAGNNRIGQTDVFQAFGLGGDGQLAA